MSRQLEEIHRERGLYEHWHYFSWRSQGFQVTLCKPNLPTYLRTQQRWHKPSHSENQIDDVTKDYGEHTQREIEQRHIFHSHYDWSHSEFAHILSLNTVSSLSLESSFPFNQEGILSISNEWCSVGFTGRWLKYANSSEFLKLKPNDGTWMEQKLEHADLAWVPVAHHAVVA